MDDSENSYSVEDYVTLNARDKQSILGNVITWAIPQTYYSNRRSKVCTVECVAGFLADNQTAGNDGIVISYVNGGQNSFSSGNREPVISITHQTTRVSGTNYESHALVGCGQLLTQARPARISLRIETSQRTSLGTFTTPPADGDVQFVICLKFKYYNQLKTASNLEDQFDMTL